MPSERCFFLFWLIQKKRPVQDLCHQTLLMFSLLFCFLFHSLIFIFVPLFSFYNLLFVHGKFDFFCFLFTVSNQEIYCVSIYIYYFFIAGSVCFSVNIAPFGNSILFFWPKFPTSRRFTKKYLKFYLKTVLLCGHREAQQVLSCINQGKTFKMTNWK